MNDSRNKLRTIAEKVSRAAEVLGELGEVLHEADGDVQQGSHRADRQQTRTEIDEPEIGWRIGFIRMLDGRCPWCGERMGNVSLHQTTGVTWQCDEGCNP